MGKETLTFTLLGVTHRSVNVYVCIIFLFFFSWGVFFFLCSITRRLGDYDLILHYGDNNSNNP